MAQTGPNVLVPVYVQNTEGPSKAYFYFKTLNCQASFLEFHL